MFRADKECEATNIFILNLHLPEPIKMRLTIYDV